MCEFFNISIFLINYQIYSVHTELSSSQELQKFTVLTMNTCFHRVFLSRSLSTSYILTCLLLFFIHLVIFLQFFFLSLSLPNDRSDHTFQYSVFSIRFSVLVWPKVAYKLLPWLRCRWLR